MAGTLHYLNADFDLSLRRRPRKLGQPSLRRAVDAMTVHSLLLGAPGDAVLLKAGVNGGFLDSLGRCGVEAPRILRHPEVDASLILRPFGWNGEAMALNDGQRVPVPHPALEIVRRVNSRAFSAKLERERFGGECAGISFRSPRELAGWLEGQEARTGGWVVKADHGNAALGNRRLRHRRLSDPDSRFVEGLLAEDDQVFVEPWLRRRADLCAVFELDGAGRVSERRIHETIYTGDGALIGALFGGSGGERQGEIFDAMEVVAAELHLLGYFGPVCFDAFVHGSGGRDRLRPLADLNCRRPMSDAAFRLWRDLFGERVLLWRFFNTRRLRPGTVEGIAADGDLFVPGRGEGFFPTSPWSIEIEGKVQRAPKLAVAFVGEGRGEVLAMESRFRGRYER